LGTNMIELAPCQLVGFEFQSTSWSDISQGGKEIVRIN
jgi:hypothetical protein